MSMRLTHTTTTDQRPPPGSYIIGALCRFQHVLDVDHLSLGPLSYFCQNVCLIHPPGDHCGKPNKNGKSVAHYSPWPFLRHKNLESGRGLLLPKGGLPHHVAANWRFKLNNSVVSSCSFFFYHHNEERFSTTSKGRVKRFGGGRGHSFLALSNECRQHVSLSRER